MVKRLLVIAVAVTQLALPALSANVDNSQSDSLNKLEQRFFSRTYQQEPEEDRLARLEKLVFGQTGTGSGDERVHKLLDSVSAADAAIQDAATGSPAAASGSSATTAPDSTSGTPANGEESSTTAGSGADTPPVDAGTDYPAVDALERKIIGKVNTERPLRARLAEMERKAFGHVSSDPDLSNRVAALQSYTKGERADTASRRRDTTGGIVPFSDEDMNDSTFDDRGGSGSLGGNGTGLLGDGGIARGSTAEGDITPSGVATRVAGMEKQMFGKPSHEPLPERLSKLEDAVFGSDPNRHSGSVIERTLKLSQAIDGARATSGVPQTHRFGTGIQQNESFPLPDVTSLPDPDMLGGGAGTGAGTTSGGTTAGKAGHPILHGIGKALGMAGVGAAALLGSIGTGMSYGSMYGMGYPYSGMYSPYGGSMYGSMYSPYGSMYSPYGYNMGLGYSPYGSYGMRGIGGFGGMGLGGMGMGMGLGGLSGMGIGGYGMGVPMFGF